MNMQFKLERRVDDVFYLRTHKNSPFVIKRRYWDMCEQFIELMDYKRTQNLLALSNTENLPDLLEQIRNDVDYDVHCAIGLGKRMPLPSTLVGDIDKA